MKILALTSIRSDYDLLSSLYKLLDQDKDIDFRLLVSGAHLSVENGYTKQYIEQDGFQILQEIETLISSDSLKSKLKTASIFLQGSIDVVSNFSPDVILYAGDREDVIMGGLLGVFLHIPTIHFYGGDHEEAGHEDTIIRHATSKLSTYHFVSTAVHKKRLLKIGENTERIYNIGSIALDRFKLFEPFSLDKIANLCSLKHSDKFSILIYHPSPVALDDDVKVFTNILEVLKSRGGVTFVSFPNTDSNSNQIVDVIRKYEQDTSFYFFKNLDRKLFLSIFKQSKFIIGNSSAGLLEAASIPIPAINVGARQKNRKSGENVIFCGTTKVEINNAIEQALSSKFLSQIKEMTNMYGDGESSQRALNLIKSLKLTSLIHKSEDPL